MAPTHEKHGAKKFQKSYFDVLGLCCSSEIPLIQRILNNLDGIKDVQVILATKTVIVLHDNLLISQLQIAKALNQARLEASVRVEGVKNYKKKWPSPYAVASGVLLLLSFLKYFFHPFQWLALGAVAIGIIPIFLRAVVAIRNLTIGDVNILVLIAVAGSIALNDYWEAGTIVFLFTTAEWLESRASHKATAAMSSLVNLVPQRAILAETGEEVNVDKVKVNTLLGVKDGEIIPIDGVVVEGSCEVDEKTLTGESFPVSKQKDSTVLAGTVNLNGYISIKTTALAEDCAVARMTKLVEDAQNKKSRTERYIDKCAKYYTPAIVVISACLAIIPTALRVHNKRQWYHLALVVLVSACPCALILSTPVAMFCALTKAATSGVFFKGADYLETLAKVKIMAFDKTGTITRAEFEVTEFKCLLDDISLSTLLYWISSIESKSNHPLAAALVAFAKSHSVEPKPDKVEQFQNFPGEGLYGKIDGKEIYIGNMKISSRAGCASVSILEGNIAEGKSTGYIFLRSIPVGVFYLTDVCRTGAKEALKELKSMGIKTAMLTGDSYAAAKHAQDQLDGGLEVVHAELLPEAKARIVKDFQKAACTAMIGDGLNDAPALATADIGIALGISGSALATETGSVILMSNDIQRIPKVARLARRVKRKVIENMILSISTKCAIIALAIAGHPLIWAAVLADVGTCLLVILNSMLLLRGKPEHRTKCCKSSAGSHANENREKCTRSELPHTHKPYCNNTKPQKSVEQRRCSSKNCVPMHQSSSSSPRSSGNGSNLNSTAKHSCCGHGNQLHESKYSSHGSYKGVFQDCGSKTQHHGQIHCHNSSKRIGEDMIDKEVHEHCHHENHGKITSKGCSTSSLKIDSEQISNKQFQVNSCLHHTEKHPANDEEIGDLVRFCCQHNQANAADSGCRNHAEECDSPSHSTINNLGGDNYASCRTSQSCMNLEKRHVGACCESFRKECCTKNGHFGANFRGGLSEIVIE